MNFSILKLLNDSTLQDSTVFQNNIVQKTSQNTTNPRIIVFDSFNNEHKATIDYNNDGIRDRSHGYVVSDIIESQTGYLTEKITASEFGREVEIKNFLKPLIQANNLSQTYINLSIGWADNAELTALILELADKGVKFYISAGNEEINRSATKELGQHENIFIVAASDGIIGEAKQNQPTTKHLSNPSADRIANGVLKPTISPEGIDLNRDGKIDFSNDVLKKPKHNLMGKPLDQVYASSLLSSMQIIPELDHLTYLMGREDIEGKVLSLKDLRELGFINEFVDQHIKDNYRTINEKETYIDLTAFSEYIWFYGNGGDIILYQEQQNSLTRLMPSPLPYPATSWAAPNALAEDVIKDLGHY